MSFWYVCDKNGDVTTFEKGDLEMRPYSSCRDTKEEAIEFARNSLLMDIDSAKAELASANDWLKRFDEKTKAAS